MNEKQIFGRTPAQGLEAHYEITKNLIMFTWANWAFKSCFKSEAELFCCCNKQNDLISTFTRDD